VNLVLWVLVAGALGACELAARTLRRGWPTAGELLRRARGHLAGRLVLIVAWLWLGWHVFAR
jgi:uncharacterized protein DUF6186